MILLCFENELLLYSGCAFIIVLALLDLLIKEMKHYNILCEK